MSASQASYERQSILKLIGGLQNEVKLAADANACISNNVIERISTSVMSSFEDRLSLVLDEKMAETMAHLEVAKPRQHPENDYTSQQQQKSPKVRRELINSNTEWTREKVRRKSRPKLIIRREIRTPLGTANIKCLKKSPNLLRENYNVGYNFELQLAFIPRTWLSQKASQIIASWDTFPSCSLTGLNFQFRPVVSDDAPIMKACRGGDISKIKCLFETGQASVNMVDESGWDLLHVSIK